MSVGRFLQQAAAGNSGGTGDDDFANVVLLLDGDGTSGDANNTFTDSSTNGFTVTESGSVVQGSFSPYGDNWSVYFDETSSERLEIADFNEIDPTSSFCVEFWFLATTTPGQNLAAHTLVAKWGGSTATNSWKIEIEGTGFKIAFLERNGSIYTERLVIDNYSSVELGRWYHVAYTWDGTTHRAFVDGTLAGSLTNSFPPDPGTSDLKLAGGAASSYFSGYISNLRIVTDGGAIYTSDFTPSTEPLSSITGTEVLMVQSNRFIENSNSRAVEVYGTPKVTPFSPFKDDDARDITTDGGSGFFNGSEYLTASDNAVFNFGTGDFTVEAWVYLTGGAGGIWTNGPTSSGSFGFYFQGTNELRCDYYGGTGLTSTIQAPDYEWHHVAVIRSGSTLSLYRNGVREATTTTSSNNTTDSFTVGRAWTNDAGGNLQGYISDLRVVKGTALYTGTSYTVPTTPLTAVTNTSALLNFQDAGIYDRSGINNLDTVGNAQIDTAVVKYGTGSLEFDGTGDYIQPVVAASELALGTGDFTIEFWMYPTSVDATIRAVLSNRYDGGSNNVFACAFDNGTGTYGFGIYFHTQATGVMSTGVSPTVNTWQHLAFVRSNGTLYIYKDGTSIGTPTSFTSDLSYTVPPLIGKDGVRTGGGTASNFVGYLDDLRITKGVARYTANFTAPGAALPKF